MPTKFLTFLEDDFVEDFMADNNLNKIDISSDRVDFTTFANPVHRILWVRDEREYIKLQQLDTSYFLVRIPCP